MLLSKDAGFGGGNCGERDRSMSGVSDRSVIVTGSRAQRTSFDETDEETENEGEEIGMAWREACNYSQYEIHLLEESSFLVCVSLTFHLDLHPAGISANTMCQATVLCFNCCSKRKR